MEMGTEGGYAEMLQNIIDAKDQVALIRTFKKIILKAYGVKSPDGREFIKSKKISKKFSQTEAFNMLYMELVTDTDAAIQFVNGIMPAKLIEKVKAKQEEAEKKKPRNPRCFPEKQKRSGCDGKMLTITLPAVEPGEMWDEEKATGSLSIW